MHAHDPFAPPRTSPDQPNAFTNASGQLPLFAVGTKKLWIMSIATFGLYGVYWFERNYRFQKRLTGESSWPLARALFSVFFVNDLLKRISAEATEAGITHAWSAGGLSGLYVASVILRSVIDRFAGKVTEPATSVVLSFVSFALVFGMTHALARAQETVNETLARTHAGFERNTHFTAANWIVIAIFAPLLLLGLLSGFLPEG
jgi:hypothetical protein